MAIDKPLNTDYVICTFVLQNVKTKPEESDEPSGYIM